VSGVKSRKSHLAPKEPGMAGIDTLVCFQTLPPLANIAHAKPAFELALRQVSSLLSCNTSRLVAPSGNAYLAGLVLPERPFSPKERSQPTWLISSSGRTRPAR
jgi:hypothetical protein